MHEFYVRFASCLPCHQLSNKRRSTRTCWKALNTSTRLRWNPHKLKKRTHFQIQKVGGMEVGLKPAGYWEYWRWLAGKFIFMFLEQGSAKSGMWDWCGLMALSYQFAAAYSFSKECNKNIWTMHFLCTQITFY